MNSTYIKFSNPATRLTSRKKNWWGTITEALLISFIPQANPDFEKKIENVEQWLIEFENGNQYPNREIGLDILQQPIMIMPWRNNYGYWTDNNLLIKDFKSHFNIVEITKEEFENHWDQFEQENESA
jgi:hypothetical protein